VGVFVLRGWRFLTIWVLYGEEIPCFRPKLEVSLSRQAQTWR
jgi:hypothetical protein